MENDDVVRGRGRNKCFWNDTEVKLLIEALQELATDPFWKTDTGFKANYMVELQKRITASLPSFDKQVHPHLESKVKWLKSKYHAITEMCKESGCQWNDIEKKIQCERQWYEDWCKTHKDARALWNVNFPWLEDLELVYGRDRATGGTAEGATDAVQNLEKEVDEQDVPMDLSSDDENEQQVDSVTQPSTEGSSMRTSSKRKKMGASTSGSKKSRTQVTGPSVEVQFQQLTTEVGSLVTGLATNFTTIAKVMANEDTREQEAKERPTQLANELMNLGIPSNDIYRVGPMILKEKSLLEFFFALPPEARKQYVLDLLSGPSNS